MLTGLDYKFIISNIQQGDAIMGLFSRKKEVTTNVKNELNKLIGHLDISINKLNTTDSISTYFNAFEDMLMTYKKLKYLEDNYDWKHGKYKWDGNVNSALKGIEANRPQAEINFVNRAYERLQRECLKLSTEKSKDNKREKFFTEFEHYYQYLEDSTIQYIQKLKDGQ